jgi:hypothetical protein
MLKTLALSVVLSLGAIAAAGGAMAQSDPCGCYCARKYGSQWGTSGVHTCAMICRSTRAKNHVTIIGPEMQKALRVCHLYRKYL